MSVFEITMRSARIACRRASENLSMVLMPLWAAITVMTASTKNSPPSARSVAKVVRIGLGSASPLVSITMRPKCGMTPRSRSTTMRCSAICRSERKLQHRQPLPSSTVFSLLSRSSASSMPASPNSLTRTAVPWPSGVSKKCFTSVVLPAPRNPVTTVTGIRAPRSRLSRRPKRPAAGEGKSSCMTYFTLPRLRGRVGEGETACTCARRLAPSRRASRASLPRKRGRGSTERSSHASEIHLQNIQAAGEAIDRVDDLALVDEDVVELDGADRRERGRRRHEGGDFLRLERVGDVVGAQAAVEEGADDDLVGMPAIRRRRVLVDIVRPEAPAAAREGVDRRHRAGRDRNRVLLVADVEQPDERGPVLGVIVGRLVGDDQQVALEQRQHGVGE